MKNEIYQIRLGLNSCYLIRGKDVVMVDGGMPNKLKLFKHKSYLIFYPKTKDLPEQIIQRG